VVDEPEKVVRGPPGDGIFIDHNQEETIKVIQVLYIQQSNKA
jgi:hypothetical protein